MSFNAKFSYLLEYNKFSLINTRTGIIDCPISALLIPKCEKYKSISILSTLKKFHNITRNLLRVSFDVKCFHLFLYYT